MTFISLILLLTNFTVLVYTASLNTSETTVLSTQTYENDLRTFGSRIVGGVNAKEGEFPHQVLLEMMGNGLIKYCGGSIIGDRWILTAAHCPYGFEPKNIFVTAGKHHFYSTDKSEQKIGVHSIFIHEFYIKHLTSDPNSVVHPFDIALLKLKSSLKFKKKVGKIALPKLMEEPNGTAIVTGWGRTTWNGSPAKVLQKVAVPIIDFSECYKAWQEFLGVEETPLVISNVCTGPLDAPGIAICSGDSGGPLIRNNNNRLEIVGVVAWAASNCGVSIAPSVYTKVSHFVVWITETIKRNGCISFHFSFITKVLILCCLSFLSMNYI